MQRLAGLPIFAVDFAQPPAAGVKAEHEQKSGGNFYAARNFIPMRRDEQRYACRNEHRADDGNDGKKIAATVFLELETLDDFLPLLIGDEPGFVYFLNIAVLHVFSGLRCCFEPNRLCNQSNFMLWGACPEFLSGKPIQEK